MSKRTERRAAERASHKIAYQQLREQQSQQSLAATPEPLPAETETDLLARAQAFFDTKPLAIDSRAVSEIQLLANRSNALLSSGPVTEAGKAVSSKNALKYGLTGRTVLLSTDQVAEYESLLASFVKGLGPGSDEELRLVQSMVDCSWRLDRIQRLESGILLKGRLEFAAKFEEHTPAQRETLIDVEAYLKYEKSIRNLHIQEARLHRRYEKDQAELTRLQTIRRREERVAVEQSAAHEYGTPSTRPRTQNGFEFSTPQLPAISTPAHPTRSHSRTA